MRVLAVIACLLAWPAFAERVVIGTSAPFPPFQMRDANGGMRGAEPEILGMICTRAKLDCSWRELTLDTLFDALDIGEIDVAATGLALTPERAQRAFMTCPYRLAKEGTSGIFALSETQALNGVPVAVTGSSIDAAAARKAGMNMVVYPDIDEAFAAVLSGEVPLFLGSPYYVAQYDTDKRLHQIDGLQTGSQGTSFAITRKRPKLARMFETELAAMSSEGVLHQIVTRWMRQDEPDPIAKCKKPVHIS